MIAALPAPLERLIAALPKVELHLHIEGTLEPEMVMAKAARHGVDLRWGSVEALRGAYQFSDLQSFLDIYYAGCDVLRDEQDFYDLAIAYFARAHADRVIHAEIFFDPQTHTARGVAMGTVIDGLVRAQRDAEARWGLTSKLILCFLRHLSEADAFATLDLARPYLQHLAGSASTRASAATRRPSSSGCSPRPGRWASRRSPTPARRARPRTSARRSIGWAWCGTITACAATRIRRWSTSWRRAACR